MTVMSSALLLAIAWFVAVNAAVSLIVWPMARRAVRRTRSRPRAGALLVLRFVPAATAAVVAFAVFLPAHLYLEPRDLDERFGILLNSIAIAGALILLRSLLRGLGAAHAMWRLQRACPRTRAGGRGRTATVDLPAYAGISLAGVLRPRVIVGGRARAALTAAEFDVALAHELAHQRAGDNLKRLAMYCAPDLFGMTGTARALEAAWRTEAEWLADAAAVDGDEGRAAALASALIKVARLPQPRLGASPVWSTFHEPGLLEARVTRLVGSVIPRVPAARCWPVASFAVTSVILSAWIAGLPAGVHALTERLIRLLP